MATYNTSKPKKTLSQISINDFSGGMIYSANPSSYKEGSKTNQYSYARGMTPFVGGSFERYNALNSGYGVTNLTDTNTYLTSYPVSMAYIGSGSAIVVLNNGRLISYGSLPGGGTAAKYDPASATAGYSIVPYATMVSSTLKNTLTYTYSGTLSHVYLGRIESDLTSSANDIYQQLDIGLIPANVPHFQLVGDDGTLYITNGNYIATLIGQGGTNGTFSATGIALPKNLTAVGLANYYGNLMILATSNFGTSVVGKTYVIPWQFNSAISTTIYELNVGYPTAILHNNDQLLVWANGTLHQFTGSTFKRMYIDVGSPAQNQVFIWNDISCWARDYGIMAYGSLEGTTDTGLHCINSNSPNIGGYVGSDPTGVTCYMSGVVVTPASNFLTRVDVTKYNSNKSWESQVYSIPYGSVLKQLIVKFTALNETLTFNIENIRGTGSTVFDTLYTASITAAKLEDYNVFMSALNVRASRVLIDFTSNNTTQLGISEIIIYYEPGTDKIQTF